MKPFKVVDESSDHKYFTIIPNYITNHSNHYEQSLYLTMKRIAGENSTCFASQETLAKKMGCSQPLVSRTLRSLEKRGWIEAVGYKPAKTRPVREYKIVDLWKKNVEFYSNNEQKTEIPKPQNKSRKDTQTTEYKIPKPQNKEEEPIREEDIYIQPKAVVGSKDSLRRVKNNLLGGKKFQTPVKIDPREWQDHAARIAEKLEIKNPSPSWFKVFKQSYESKRRVMLDQAYSYVVDAKNVNDKEKLFYWKWNKLVGNL